jgi:hypothetical protein
MLALAVVAALAAQSPTTPPAAPSPTPKNPTPPPKTMSNPVVTIKTNMGSIDVELVPDKAPKTVENFLGYVKAAQYDNTIFHRVIAGFMIQAGGYDKQMSKKATRALVVNEAGSGLKNDTGTIAMARTEQPHILRMPSCSKPTGRLR